LFPYDRVDKKVGAFCPYLTIQSTNVEANKFEWYVWDGAADTVVEKIRESFLPENYTLWDDKYGKIHGNFVTEKPDGEEDFVLRTQYSGNLVRQQREVKTKVITRGKMKRSQELPYGAWCVHQSPDIGYIGQYIHSRNTSAVPRKGMPLSPMYDENTDTYASWATVKGRFMPVGTRAVGMCLFDGVKNIGKIVWQQAGAGGQNTAWDWNLKPMYIIEYLDPVDLQERIDLNLVPNPDPALGSEWWLHSMCRAFDGAPDKKLWKVRERTLGDFEHDAYKFNYWDNVNNIFVKEIPSAPPPLPGQYVWVPWKTLSSKGTGFGATKAWTWYDIDDMPEFFQAQYFRIVYLSYGGFRDRANDVQWNIGSVKFISNSEIFGTAFLRNFMGEGRNGGYPEFNDPDNVFYRPDITGKLEPNPVRTIVMEEDTSLQSDVELQAEARRLLLEYINVPATIDVECIFGFYRKMNTVRVIDELLGDEENYLINNVTYSKSGGEPSVSIEMTHNP